MVRTIVVSGSMFYASYRDEFFKLLPVGLGISESIALAFQLCREYLIEQVFRPERERRQLPPAFRNLGRAPKH